MCQKILTLSKNPVAKANFEDSIFFFFPVFYLSVLYILPNTWLNTVKMTVFLYMCVMLLVNYTNMAARKHTPLPQHMSPHHSSYRTSAHKSRLTTVRVRDFTVSTVGANRLAANDACRYTNVLNAQWFRVKQSSNPKRKSMQMLPTTVSLINDRHKNWYNYTGFRR